MSDRDLTAQAQADLAWLERQGAVAGLAAVIAERRRQIETFAYSVAYDRVHNDGDIVPGLVGLVSLEALEAINRRITGDYGPVDVEKKMAKAGALSAAEVDRLRAAG